MRSGCQRALKKLETWHGRLSSEISAIPSSDAINVGWILFTPVGEQHRNAVAEHLLLLNL
jgi:hypothetical protein